MTTLDEQKRMILPFLQRAEEIEKHDPKVAYYCRMYAVEQGLAIPQRDPKISGILTALLSKLERDKAAANLGPPEEDKVYCEEFALKVFARADRVDRAGAADKRTAVTFLAAFYFFELLAQFGELAVDVAEKQRYAAWKAADINRALREGRAPTPGPPGGAAGEAGAPGAGVSGEPAAPAAEDEFGLPSVPGGAPSLPPASAGAGDGFPSAPPFVPPPLPPQPPAEHPGAPGEGAGQARASSSGTGSEPGEPLRYGPGAKVLYNAEGGGSGGAVRGTVAAVDQSGEERLYAVALPDRIVRAASAQLAPELGPGDSAVYRYYGSATKVVVSHVDAGRWPPRFDIVFDDGSERTVPAEFLDPEAPSRTASNASAAAAAPPKALSPQPPSLPPQLPPSLPPATYPQPPTAPRPAPPPAAALPAAAPAAPAAPVPGFQPGLTAISDAHKATKYAASSLSFEDVPTAVRHLTEALRLLTQPSGR